MKKFFQKYRGDIMWLVGVGVALAGLAINLNGSSLPRMRVTVPLQRPLGEKMDIPGGFHRRSIATFTDGTVATNPFATFFIIDNPGTKTIRPEDFTTPLQIIPSAGERILSVTAYEGATNAPLTSWSVRSNGCAVMSPALFNPSDNASFWLITDRAATSQPPFRWTARIAGVKTIETQGLEEMLLRNNLGVPFFLVMNGSAVIAFFVALAILSAIAIRAWRESLFRLRRTGSRPILVSICAVILAVIAAECLAYVVIYDAAQFIGSYLGLLGFVVLVVWGIVRGARAPKSQRRGLPRDRD